MLARLPRPATDKSITRTAKRPPADPCRVSLRRIAVAALALLVLVPTAGAQLGGDGCRVPTGEPTFDGDAEVRTWEGDADPGLAGGTLEIRSHRSGAYVMPWNGSGWRVEIGEVDPRDELEPTVEASTDGGTFSLTAVVERSSPLPTVRVDGVAGTFAQVKVHVPDKLYDEIVVRDVPASTQNVQLGGISNGTGSSWQDLRVLRMRADHLDVRGEHTGASVANAAGETVEVATDNHPLAAADIDAPEIEAATDNGRACLTEAHGETIRASADNGELVLADLDADRVNATLDNGDLDARRIRAGSAAFRVDNGEIGLDNATIEDLSVRTDNGGLTLRGLRVADLTYVSDNGDLDADLFPMASGTWDLRTDNGMVEIHLPTGERYGYDANATVDNGDPELSIPGTETVSEGPDHMHVRTVGYADREIQTRVEIQGDNADLTADDRTTSTAGALQLPVSPEAAAGVGLTAAVAAAFVLLWPKLKVLVAPLYTRLSRDEILDNDARRRILEAVRSEPGIHFRGLQRRVDVGRGILEHHLDKLVEAGYLAEQSADSYRCYFPNGEVDRRVMEVADRLRADGARAVLQAVTRRPGASLTELAETANISSSTVGYHLDKLVEAGLVTKSRHGGRLAVDLTDLGTRAIDDLELT